MAVRKPQCWRRHRKPVPVSNIDQSPRARSFAILLISIYIFVLTGATVSGSPVAVRYKEGLLHGFLVLSTLDSPRSRRDLTQVPHGNQITSRPITLQRRS
jgi:hypothetical protein